MSFHMIRLAILKLWDSHCILHFRYLIYFYALIHHQNENSTTKLELEKPLALCSLS